MNRTNYTLGRIDASRCSVCRHPDREGIDRDLVLKRRSQSEVARLVGVDRSTVSRHVKNHVMPKLAESVLIETKDVALGTIIDEFSRVYAESWVTYERAHVSGDLRIAASVLDQQRRLLEVMVRYAEKMKGATLDGIIENSEEAERRHYEEIQSGLIAKLDDLAERHARGIQRPTSSDDNDAGSSESDDDESDDDESGGGPDAETE